MKRTNTATWNPNRRYWQINVQKDGKRKSFYSSVAGRNGQREANRKADAWLDDGVESIKLRTNDILNEYLEIKQQTTSPSNFSKEKYHVENYLRPVIGDKRAADLTDQDFQKILTTAFRHKSTRPKAKSKEAESQTVELSKKTMQNIRATMFAVARMLRSRKIVFLDADSWEIPKSARLKGKDVLQPNDLATLFSSDQTTFRNVVCKCPYIHAFRFLILTGLRPGEMKGLVPADAKEAIKTGVLKIHRSINVHKQETKGKNENAIRSILLSSRAAQELKAQLEMLPDDGTLFGIYSNDSFYNQWKRYCAYNHIKYVSPYELRHTFVSVVKTLPEGEVKSIVGHSGDMDTFGVYGHAIAGELQETTQKIEKIFDKLIDG